MGTAVKPYDNSDNKKVQIEQMFDNVASKYDFLNQTLSGGLHNTWRKKAIAQLANRQPKDILDIATGTADLAIAAMVLKPNKIIGVDLSEGMLELGRKKLIEKKLDHIISLEKGDAENLRFPENSFDAIMVSFGIRNFENLEKGLISMYRCLRPNGQLMVLEFSKPKNVFVKAYYYFHNRVFVQLMGKLFSKDSRAYKYLPASVAAFPEGDEFLSIMRKSGYQNVKDIRLTFGVVSIYNGFKS
jgi:demethylmenaquinone methyltransferase / 2-methoxy-6-polyprenyl-1,4-benzoquinol methylase